MRRTSPGERTRARKRRDIVVIGGSAGSFEPLRAIVRGLRSYPGTVLVVIHVPARAPSILPALLSRERTLPARHARDGERLAAGTILVAPPDRHLVVEGDHVRLDGGPRENGVRPAADPLFRSAAHQHGPRVVGVVLSGALHDGARGLALVKRAGGTTIIQSPQEARFESMPRSAAQNADVDHVVGQAEIAPLLQRLARTRAPRAPSEKPNDEKGARATGP